MDFVPFFDEQIKLQRHAIAWYKVWLAALVAAGLLVILISIIIGRFYAPLSSALFPVGGGFMLVLGVFPGKEIIQRRETINKYNCLRQNFEHYPELSPDDQKALTKTAIDMLGK